MNERISIRYTKEGCVIWSRSPGLSAYEIREWI